MTQIKKNYIFISCPPPPPPESYYGSPVNQKLTMKSNSQRFNYFCLWRAEIEGVCTSMHSLHVVFHMWISNFNVYKHVERWV